MVNELVQAITERIMLIPNLKKVGKISRVEAQITKFGFEICINICSTILKDITGEIWFV